MVIDKKKFIEAFRVETEELLISINKGFVEIENCPENGPIKSNILDELSRTTHTLKGAARMMGFDGIQKTAHKIEDILALIKENKIEFNGKVSNAIFHALDNIKITIEKIVKGEEEEHNSDTIIEEIATSINKKEKKEEEIIKQPQNAEPLREKEINAEPTVKSIIDKKENNENQTKLENEYIRIPISKINDLLNLMGEIVINKVKSTYKIEQVKKLTIKSNKILKLLNEVENKIKEELNLSDEYIFNEDGVVLRASQEIEEASGILGLIHQTQNNFEDLRNGVYSTFETLQSENIHLSPVISDLQYKIKKIRMLPCSKIFQEFPRLVRDIAQDQNKQIQLEIKGENTELDKKVLFSIKGPLIHLLRNSVDHGIEKPDIRVACGKPKLGKIILSASQEGGCVALTIFDDGAGINNEELTKVALSKGIIETEELSEMSENEIQNLIFKKGISTSKIITDISGRGIGLDAVYNEVKNLKGQIDINSKTKIGTTIKLKLPLTIAVMRVLIVKVLGINWAIQIDNLEETLKVPLDNISTIENKMVIQVRGKSIPLLNLAEALGMKEQKKEVEKNTNRNEKSELTVIIANHLNNKYGFIVDQIIKEEEIFIKSTGNHLGKIEGVSGITILANGEILVVLDLNDIIMKTSYSHAAYKKQKKIIQKKKKKKILVVEDSVTTRELEKAILENAGFEVETAIDGVDALTKLSKLMVDIIVSDIQMPRMDGFELCKKIKSDENLKEIPLIFVTSVIKEEEKRKGLNVGARAYITKNQFDQMNLIETIERILG